MEDNASVEDASGFEEYLEEDEGRPYYHTNTADRQADINVAMLDSVVCFRPSVTHARLAGTAKTMLYPLLFVKR